MSFTLALAGSISYELDELIGDKRPNTALVGRLAGAEVVVLHWDHVTGSWRLRPNAGRHEQSWLQVEVESPTPLELAGVGFVAEPVAFGRRENQVGPVLWSGGRVIGEAVLEGWEGPDGELLARLALASAPPVCWSAPGSRARLSALAV